METKGKRILVVDDDTDHLFITREVLAREGYEVLTHQSPFGVIGLVQSAAPDLVLLDVHMPSLPGDDLAAFLRADERTRHVPLVLYSSAGEDQLGKAILRHRLRGFIQKGDITELRRKVRYFLQDQEVNSDSLRKELYAME